MKRKRFFQSILSAGAILTLPSAVTKSGTERNKSCVLAPEETAGPFPIKTPAQLVRENIVSDRSGVPFVIRLKVQDQKNDCKPMDGVHVDIWHCDAGGYYSEYGGIPMQREDFTDKHFCRGRQTTDHNGEVSFISIYPGWYPGRAPHIHVEVKDKNEKSLRITQVAFPEHINETVYRLQGYKGKADTPNKKDSLFKDSLKDNMADSVEGNTSDGFVLIKSLVV